MELSKIKLDIKDFVKGIIATITACGLYYGINTKLDRLESKIESLNRVSDKDKEIIYLKLAQLDRDFKDGKDKYTKEMSVMTNRIFQLYGILPKETKIENGKDTD